MDFCMLELAGHALSSHLKITCSRLYADYTCLDGNTVTENATQGLHDVILQQLH